MIVLSYFDLIFSEGLFWLLLFEINPCKHVKVTYGRLAILGKEDYNLKKHTKMWKCFMRTSVRFLLIQIFQHFQNGSALNGESQRSN